MAWGRFGSAGDYDALPIETWMNTRDDDDAQRQAYEEAGYGAWTNSTRTGENLQAAQPSDLVALGRAALSPEGSVGGSPDGASDGQSGSDSALAAPRYVKANPGDSISSLLGTSHPGAVGRFAALNGMDGTSSTIYPGRVYRLPGEGGDPSADEAALGGQLLRRDNARLLAQQTGGNANDQFMTRLLAAQNVWTGLPVGARSLTPPLQPTGAAPKPWWDRDAKIAAGVGAYALGGFGGILRAARDTAGDIKEAAPFELGLTGFLGPQAQQSAVGALVSGASDAARSVKAAADHPSQAISIVGDKVHRAIDNMSPMNAPMSGSLADVVDHQFHAGLNFGETATNVAGLFAGGETLEGLRAVQAFEATKPARIAKFVDQGANPKLAEYLAQPYEGMGHHALVPRRAKVPGSILGVPVEDALAGQRLPAWMIDSPLNVSVPRGISRGDFYEYHYKVDPKAYGFRLPADLNGGKGWSGKQLGLTKYSLPQRVWYGMPVPLKDGLATIPFVDAPAVYQELDGHQ